MASGSPRRKELLEQIGISFRVIKSNAEEVITKTEPGEIVKDLSAQKAADVAASVEEGIVLGADTIVCIDGKILGKPKDRADAGRMLELLQGREHSVFTGVTLIRKQPQGSGLNEGETEKDGEKAAEESGNGAKGNCPETVHSFFCETKVYVHEMSREEIERYLDTKGDCDKADGGIGNANDAKFEWEDKAGSYGIQGPFAAYVDGIQGDYNNVVGLPVAAVYQALKKLSFS